MKKILLVCGVGITSSLLVQDLNKRFEDNQCYFVNANLNEVGEHLQSFQIIIIAPQLKFIFADIEKICNQYHKLCILLDFKEYNVQSIYKITGRYLSSIRQRNPFICFVKDNHSGYMSQLYINKMYTEFRNRKEDCQIQLFTLNEYKERKEEFDYYVFEPKLICLIPIQKNYMIIRASDFYSLNVDEVVNMILDNEDFL